MSTKLVARAVVLALVPTGLIVALGATAEAYGRTTVFAADWGWTDSQTAHTAHFEERSDAPVGSRRDSDGKHHISRFYATFALTSLAGRSVTEAGFRVRERSVADCAASAPLELWRTDPVTPDTTWADPPAEIERLGTPAYASGQSCPNYLLVDVLAAVQAARVRGDDRITLELRVGVDGEGDTQYGRTLSIDSVGLDLVTNGAPAVGQLSFYDKGCAPVDRPRPITAFTYPLQAKVSDPDQVDQLSGAFAVWPVDSPADRRELTAGQYQIGLLGRDWDFTGYPHGAVLAWSARAYDGHTWSDWAAPCYLQVDRVRPAAVTLTSTDYPADAAFHGGPGVPGRFTVDAGGDPDAVKYEYQDSAGSRGTIVPETPGGPATFTYTPRYEGQAKLSVWAIDAAGNNGVATDYSFLVRRSAPEFTVDLGGIGLPSRLNLRPGLPGVVEYRLHVGTGPEQVVAAQADGTATAEITFTEVGFPVITVANYTADGLAGVTSQSFHATDAPAVTSPGYDSPYYNAIVGEPKTFTFEPRRPNVVGYEYQTNWDQPFLTVPAGEHGVGTLTWAPDNSEFHQMLVRSVQADGSTSEWAYPDLMIIDIRPYVWSYLYSSDYPAGGVGVEATFVFASEKPEAEVAEFVYQLNGGPVQTVAAVGPDASVSIAPDRSGENVIVAWTRYADGSVSPSRTWTFLVAE